MFSYREYFTLIQWLSRSIFKIYKAIRYKASIIGYGFGQSCQLLLFKRIFYLIVFDIKISSKGVPACRLHKSLRIINSIGKKQLQIKSI